MEPVLFVCFLCLLSFHAWLEWEVNRKFGGLPWFALLFGFVGLALSLLVRISQELTDLRKSSQQNKSPQRY